MNGGEDATGPGSLHGTMVALLSFFFAVIESMQLYISIDKILRQCFRISGNSIPNNGWQGMELLRSIVRSKFNKSKFLENQVQT